MFCLCPINPENCPTKIFVLIFVFFLSYHPLCHCNILILVCFIERSSLACHRVAVFRSLFLDFCCQVLFSLCDVHLISLVVLVCRFPLLSIVPYLWSTKGHVLLFVCGRKEDFFSVRVNCDRGNIVSGEESNISHLLRTVSGRQFCISFLFPCVRFQSRVQISCVFSLVDKKERKGKPLISSDSFLWK